MRRLLTLALLASACTTATTGTTVQAPSEPVVTASGSSEPTCWTAPPGVGPAELTLVDVTGEAGLVDPLTGMHGHAAIWTDIEPDGVPDLLVGTFADRDNVIYRERGAEGPSPDRLLRSGEVGYQVVDGFSGALSRTSGGVSADLDDDGDLDLVVSRNIKDGSELTPTQILENDAGSYAPVDDAGIPEELGGRSVAVFDYDGDNLLDLFIVEDRYTGGSSVLLHNEGDLRFSVDRESGIPDDVFGLGVAVGDFNEDRSADLFVSGSNRLFLSASGGFEEAANDVFAWDVYGDEDDVAGSSVGDINNDGHLDLVVGHHYNSTVDFGEKVPVRLYLNDGTGTFRDVTDASGLTPLSTKAPHVEIQDMNNDGFPDIVTSASAEDGPAVFMATGINEEGVPRFETPDGLGDAQYWVAAPTADYDRDGRLDVFMVEWEPALPSLLLHNETESGNWLEVSVDSRLGHGLGWTVQVDTPDGTTRAATITATQGYSAGVLPYAHFGLGNAEDAAIRIIPPRGDVYEHVDVAVNQHFRWPNGCGSDQP